MQKRTFSLLLIITAFALSAAAVDSPEKLAAKSAESWGGQEKFAKLGVIRMQITENETLPDGTKNEIAYTAYVDTSLQNSRIEWPRALVTVRNGSEGWATISGKPETRPQTPRMVPGINHKKILPLLLPYTLELDGLELGETTKESSFKKTPAYRFPITASSMFFDTPVTSNQWKVWVARDDYRLLGAGYLPVAKFETEQPEGMQYSILETTKVKGVTFPSVIQVEGLNKSGMTTKHGRTVRIKVEVVEEPSPALFMRPDKLQALEEDE